MKKYAALVFAAALMLFAAGCSTKEEAGNITDKTEQTDTILQAQLPKDGDEIAVVTTSLGVIKLQLYPEEAPKAVENFKALIEKGYYDGITFHRVIDGFMIQGGDPTGTGRGGESAAGEDFEDEISPDLHFYRGALAMANKGPNTNGSQFFIVQNKNVAEEGVKTVREARDGDEKIGITIGEDFYNLQQLFPDPVLDYYTKEGGTIELEYIFGKPYTIFGQVFEGMDVVDKIATVEVNAEDSKPLEDVMIEKVELTKYEAQGN